MSTTTSPSKTTHITTAAAKTTPTTTTSTTFPTSTTSTKTSITNRLILQLRGKAAKRSISSNPSLKKKSDIRSQTHHRYIWTGKNICRDYKGFICDIVPDLNQKGIVSVNFNNYNFNDKDLTLINLLLGLKDLDFFHANSNNFTGKDLHVKMKDEWCK
ncbi:hypothetical protein L2E82_02938 [Cichorium intybus]|uniref:Uncharacterized protein n=1 Tax=Cichorium intybus TaxID=13427 RepID=A0ACB9H565_CICIN|nr:hypothetical protein L2E82_02938 [Cichorium intybus]